MKKLRTFGSGEGSRNRSLFATLATAGFWRSMAQFFPAIFLFALALGCSNSDATGKGAGKDGKRPPREEVREVGLRTTSNFPAAFSPDGKLLVVLFGPAGKPSANVPPQRVVQLWDVETEKLLHTFQLEKPGSDVFFFDAGKKILTSDYGTVTVFDVPTHASDAKHFKDHRAMAMMPDGKRFLVYTQDQAGRALEIWDAFTAKLLQKFPVAIDPIQPAKISPDEKWALLPDPRGGQKGIDDGTILIWDLSKGEIRTSLSREKQIYSPVAFTPDSKHFAAQHIDAEKRDNEKYSLRLYDVPTAKFLRTLAPSLDAGFIAFSPDGKELVILDPERMKLQEGRKPHVFDTGLRRLQVETGKQLYSVRIPTEGGVVAVLSPDASRLFLGSGDSERLRLEIWDTVQGKKLRTLQPKRK